MRFKLFAFLQRRRSFAVVADSIVSLPYRYRFNGGDGTFNIIEVIGPMDQVIAELSFWDEPDTDEAERVGESAKEICRHLNQWYAHESC